MSYEQYSENFSSTDSVTISNEPSQSDEEVEVLSNHSEVTATANHEEKEHSESASDREES